LDEDKRLLPRLDSHSVHGGGRSFAGNMPRQEVVELIDRVSGNTIKYMPQPVLLIGTV
jgi:hypothetical protein